jgi:hypothetical protein
MSNELYAVGTDPSKSYTTSNLIHSLDGINWTPAASGQIFPNHYPLQSVDYTSSKILVLTSMGQSAVSNNAGASWTISNMTSGTIGFAAMCGRYCTTISSTNLFVACGWQNYPQATGSYAAGSQVAQIYTSPDGAPGNWQMRFTHPSSNSIFYRVIAYQPYGMFAVGAANGQGQIWRSNDGSTWTMLSNIPSSLGPIYDIAQSTDGTYLLATGVGFVIKIDLSFNVTLTYLGTVKAPITRIAFKNGLTGQSVSGDPAAVAISAQAIYYTLDGVSWQTHTQPGYYFNSVIWYRGSWYVGTYSDLNKYTYWVSSDSKTWTGYNNGMHVYDWAIP